MRIWLPLALVLVLLPWADAAARMVELSRINGALEIGTTIGSQEIESGNAPARSFDRYHFDEKIELAADGHLVTPKLTAFRLAGNFGARQQLSQTSDADSEDSRSLLGGFDTQLKILPVSRYSLMLFANRSEDTTVQSFGTDTETLSEAFGANLRIGIPLFPGNASWQRRRFRSDSGGGVFSNLRDETRDILEVTAVHNSESARVDLLLRQEDVDDDSFPSVGGDYRLRQADGTVGYRWGPYFEKSWRTRARYFRRDGQSDFESAVVSSILYWDPTDSLSLRFLHDFDALNTNDQRTLTNSGSFSLDHQHYESLHTGFGMSVDHAAQSRGERSAYATNLSLEYDKRLPWSSRMAFDTGVRFRVEDNDLEDSLGRVTEETFRIPGPTDPVALLEESRILPGSIEVRINRNGSLLTEPADYIVVPIGDRISIDVGPSGVLNPGDTVLVDYEYEFDPNATIARSALNVGAGWERRWLGLRYDHSEAREWSLAGRENATLDDTRRESFRADVHGRRKNLSAAASAIYTIDRTGSADYDQFAARLHATWTPLARLRLTGGLVGSYRTFTDLDRETGTVSTHLSAFWRIRPRWTFRVFGSFRDTSDSEDLDRRDYGLGAKLHLRFEKLAVTPTLMWTFSQRGQSSSSDLRAALKIRRDF